MITAYYFNKMSVTNKIEYAIIQHRNISQYVINCVTNNYKLL